MSRLRSFLSPSRRFARLGDNGAVVCWYAYRSGQPSYIIDQIGTGSTALSVTSQGQSFNMELYGMIQDSGVAPPRMTPCKRQALVLLNLGR